MDPKGPNSTGSYFDPLVSGASPGATDDQKTSNSSSVDKQLPQGSRLEGSDIHTRQVAIHTGPVPSITRPLHNDKSQNFQNTASSDALRQLQSHLELHDEMIGHTTVRSQVEMQERLERVYQALEKHSLRSGKVPDAKFLEQLTRDEHGKPVLKLQDVKSLFDMILHRKEAATDRLNQRNRSAEAWRDFFTERRSLEKLTREMAEMVALYCEEDLMPESVPCADLIDLSTTADSTPDSSGVKGSLLTPLLPPPEESLISFDVTEEPSAEQKERDELIQERDHLREKIAELEERLSVAEQQQISEPDSEIQEALKPLTERLDRIESELGSKQYQDTQNDSGVVCCTCLRGYIGNKR